MHNPVQRISALVFEALSSYRRPANWLPLFAFWLLQALGLLALTRFPELPGSAAVAGLLSRWFDAEVAEYPRLYLELPGMQRRLYLGLAVTVGPLCQGAALLSLLGFHSRDRIRRERPWLVALRRWPGLVLLNLIGLALFLGPLLAVQKFLLPGLADSGLGRPLYLGTFAFGFFTETLLLYATLRYVAFESGPLRSIAESARFSLSHIGVSLGLVLVPFFLALPLQGMNALRGTIARQFRPELILHVLLLTSFITLAILFLQLSGLVRYYVEEVLRRPADGRWDGKAGARSQRR